MFNNIGGKIKVLAQVICWIGIIASILIGGFLIIQGAEQGQQGGVSWMAIHGFLIFLIGPLASWVSSFMTYGLGELIENSDILVENSDILVENSRASIDNGKLTFVKATPKSVVVKTEREKNDRKQINKCKTENNQMIIDKMHTFEKWRNEGFITEEEYQNALKALHESDV